MTVSQVKQTEKIAQEVIAKNEEVFAKDSSLASAKAIQGLRAVFNETYPDPVRVVSIGIPVDDLLADPASPAGNNTSIEFCGGTHLKRSGHIGDFIIASEEAIAKGIRRIQVLTGKEATKALKKSELFENNLKQLEKRVIETKKFDKDLVKEIVELTQEISQSSISYWKKDELRQSLNKLKKQLDDYERASKASVLNDVVELAKKIAESKNGQKFIVEVLPAGANAKALDAALKQVKSLSPHTAAMFFSSDNDAKKVICLSAVPTNAVEAGLKANEWIKSVCDIINGKGGGKSEASQATGNNVSAIDQAVHTAVEFAKLKLES